MSQISPPIRIVLIAGVVFLAAWFTVLKPKPAADVDPATTTTTTTTTTPPATAPGQATTETAPQTGSATTTTPAPQAEAPPVTIPAEELAKLPNDVAKALKDKKIVVLGVIGDLETPWRPLADDDRFVSSELKKVNTYDGGVFVKQVLAGDLSTYGALVNDLGVLQTPSVVVIDANLKGRVVTGYADRISLNQVISDAKDAGTEPDTTGAYPRELNEWCGNYNLRLDRHSWSIARGKKPTVEAAKRLHGVVVSYQRQLAAIKVPKEFKGLAKDLKQKVAQEEKASAALVEATKSRKLKDFRAVDKLIDDIEWAELDRRFEDAGATNCAVNRRA